MEPQKALNIIAAQCSKREYATSDVLAKLKRWEIGEQDIAAIIQWLQQHHFLSDERYAVAYARDKFRFKYWGKSKIEMMLRRKQLPAEIIKTAIAQLSEDDYESTCLELLQRKNRTLREEDPQKRKAKLIRFALSKGYGYETILAQLPRVSDNRD